MGLLEITPADLFGGDVSGDRQHGNPAAIGVEQAVYEVQVARTTAARAHRQFTCERRLGGRREPSGLLVAYMLPADPAVAAERICEPIERVAGDSVNPPHSRRLERLHHDFGHRASHN
jgi:hypothetical protein